MIIPNPKDRLCCESLIRPSRRLFLAAAGSLTASVMMPRLASAAGARDPRLVVVILRGALDGLSAVPPIGDPSYAALRPDIGLEGAGADAALPLDGTFALNPGLKNLHAMVKRGEALVVHATATGYRNRSHFDGQDVLENGSPSPGLDSGWLNRAVAAMPSAGRTVPVHGLGIGATTPLILRGPAPTFTWSPPQIAGARPDTIERLALLYAAVDPELSRTLGAGVDLDRMTVGDMGESGANAALKGIQRSFVRLADGTAKLMAAPEGPRVAALSYDGWDTHANEGDGKGRLTNLLGGLDAALEALRTGLGDVWKDTAVVVVTEFGRTARENGTDGTDHGTGAAAFLLGGAVKGGRVVADWPGLADEDLLDGRDLKPTTDLRAVLKGVLADHLGIPAGILAGRVFPGSENIRPLDGLIT